MYRLSGVNRRLRVDAFYGRRQGERLYFRKEHCTYRSSYSRRPHCGTVHGVGQERYDSSNHADNQRYNYSCACSNPPYAQYNYSQGMQCNLFNVLKIHLHQFFPTFCPPSPP
uniref:Uncharacterized protein n=1 Tax=Trichuris muris TaxID=70415 RepID=A0A5S6QD79_TRIMR